uniref:uncharacterized protein LOC120328654 n=1 Tax=Styela clava TaxID=7725 RepID=UPI001939352C|nr:uncharacterized protein LOC120328654 [Styela clava]
MDSIRLSNIEFGLKHSTHKNQAGLSDDLESVEDTYDLVEVLHKHKNDPVSVIQDCVKEIFIVNYELQDQNIKVFHSTISKCDFLESLKLHYCGNSVNLEKFLDSLKNMNCQIEKISIWGMCKLVQYFETLVMVMRKSKTKTLEIQAVQLKSEDLTEMQNVLVKHSSNKLSQHFLTWGKLTPGGKFRYCEKRF